MDERKLIDDAIGSIDAVCNGLTIGDVKLNDITIRVGSRIVKFEQVSNNEYPLDKEIREEYSRILTSKMKEIHGVITTKFNDTLRTLQMAKDEYTRKEQLLLDKLKKAAPMPQVTMEHARQGLSIIKGDRQGEIFWLVRRNYAPKTVDFVPIKPSFAEKLFTPIFIMISTVESKVTGVSTRKLGGLELFQHYHQSNPDCWGRWKYPQDYKTPEDIIRIANDAEAVLENVNTNSIAKHEPIGLPKDSVLRRNLMDEQERKIRKDRDTGDLISIVPPTISRTGNTSAEDVWSI